MSLLGQPNFQEIVFQISNAGGGGGAKRTSKQKVPIADARHILIEVTLPSPIYLPWMPLAHLWGI